VHYANIIFKPGLKGGQRGPWPWTPNGYQTIVGPWPEV